MLTLKRMAILPIFLLLGSCLDFGYNAHRPEPRDSGPPVRPDGCVEGPADFLAAEVILQFSALDVDQHLATIRSGGVIGWVNGSSQVHTATAGAPGADIPPESGGFESGRMGAGGSTWAFRFCDPRTLEWYCRTHPAQMKGYLIVVQ